MKFIKTDKIIKYTHVINKCMFMYIFQEIDKIILSITHMCRLYTGYIQK